MAAKPWSKTLTTPEGVAVFPRLLNPDARFGEPRYEVTIRFEGEVAEEFKAELESLAEQALAHQQEIDPKFKKLKTLAIPLKQATDKEGNVLDGVWDMHCKCRAFITTKAGATIENKPAIVDAKKNPISVDVWGGSKIKVAIQLNPYAQFGGGISPRLRAVQVLQLITASGAGGYFSEEDGFEADESQRASNKKPATQAAEEDTSEEDIDF